MSFNLQKGDAFNLTKKEPSLKKIMIGLGWEMLPGNQLDLDASAFILGANGKLISNNHFIFYNNLKSPDGAVQHTGDNRSGDADGDDEMILVNLTQLNADVKELIVVATIYEAASRGHHFGLLKDAYIRIVDVETKREICRYDLDAEFGSKSDVEFGKLNLVNGEWHFTALGLGGHSGLQGFINKYN